MSIDCPPTTLPESTGSILLEPETPMSTDDWADVQLFHLGFNAGLPLIPDIDEKCRGNQDNQSLPMLEGHTKLSYLLFIYIIYKMHSEIV
jgi:hypothetical protein